MKPNTHNTAKKVLEFPPNPAPPGKRNNRKGRKAANKLLKLGISFGVLAAIALLISFEGAVIVGLGLIIGSKILPDFIKPKP